MNVVILQNHLRVNLEFKKNPRKPPTLDPMNAKTDLVTLNYVKKNFHMKKKVFRFADIAFCGHSYRNILVTEQPNR